MADKEYKLGNKALELYRYTIQVTKPVPDDKADAKDVARVMRTIAKAKTVEEMRELLIKTADRLDSRPGRARFPKSESFCMIADLRDAARDILRGVHAANETNFVEHSEERLKEIKAVIDECNLMLQLVALSNDLGYADIGRVETWPGKILDVKRMCLAWLKKDGERAKKNRAERDRGRLGALIALVREILENSRTQAKECQKESQKEAPKESPEELKGTARRQP